MKSKLLYILLVYFGFSFFQASYSNQIIIKYKVEDEIITNNDIINEINYLVSLNKNLKNLSQENIYKISVNSIIKEKIKYIELIKYFDFENENKELEKIIMENLNSNFGTDSKEQLVNYLNSLNLSFNEIKEKIKIEILWNKLIYDRYIRNVSIDKGKLIKKLKNETGKGLIEEYNIEEILFELNEGENVNQKYSDIIKFVEVNNFNSAAIKYSISPSSKSGGKIGWIKKTQLSSVVINIIERLNKNELSKPLQTGNGFLIIKLVDKKKIKEKIDLDKELDKLIEIETDRQLNQYSTNFFNKLKKNIFINEL